MPRISIVFPVYLPSEDHKKMTDKNIMIAKSMNNLDCEWVIVETGSDYYLREADIYIYEKHKTTPGESINRAFQSASGEYVVYLSNDVTVCERWIDLMMDCFREHKDCGIASLGNNEHNDSVENSIIESFYFSVAMLRKEDAWYSKEYKTNFLDTDLAFRLHLEGKKFYKNLNGLVYHKTHATVGKFSGDMEDYNKSLNHFRDKYKNHENDHLYRIFAGL